MMTPAFVDELRFDTAGLIPAVAQDARSGQVLMLAYMNRQSLLATLATGKACYWSRSRQELWTKGDTSGCHQYVRDIAYDCDRDALLLQVDQVGAACHTGARSCFDSVEAGAADQSPLDLDQLYAVIRQRQATGDPEKSYTARLMGAGKDRVLKKVAEEAGEVILASKNDDPDELIRETADLWFHSLMVLAYHGVTPRAVMEELERRRR